MINGARHIFQVVDWNKLEAEVKDEEKKEQLDGDAGVQRLFQQIYAGAQTTPQHKGSIKASVVPNAMYCA